MDGNLKYIEYPDTGARNIGMYRMQRIDRRTTAMHWQIHKTGARHFRRAYATSPDRYRTMRRLALARRAIQDGVPLAAVAAESGFADQSHMTRQFKRVYGVTPAVYARGARTFKTADLEPI